MIFPDIERFDHDPAGFSDSIYSFLARSAWEKSEKVRSLINTWYKDFPAKNSDDLLNRLRCDDDQVFCASFFELYLYQILQKLGLEVEVHPDLNNGSAKQPDFFVREKDISFYLEAKTKQEEPSSDLQSQRRIEAVIDKINEIKSPDFFAHVDIEGKMTKSIEATKIKHQVEKWFKSLNYDNILETYKLGKELPEQEFPFERGRIIVSPFPKQNKRGSLGQFIGFRSYGFRVIVTKDAIRKAIKDKSSRYGILEKPFIIAINLNTRFYETEDVFEALFGTEKIRIDVNPTSTEAIPFRAKDGVWKNRINKRVSGVLIIPSLDPWRIVNSSPELFLNPWATFPYNGELKQFTYYQAGLDGLYHRYQGIHIRELFQLPEKWPED